MHVNLSYNHISMVGAHDLCSFFPTGLKTVIVKMDSDGIQENDAEVNAQRTPPLLFPVGEVVLPTMSGDQVLHQSLAYGSSVLTFNGWHPRVGLRRLHLDIENTQIHEGSHVHLALALAAVQQSLHYLSIHIAYIGWDDQILSVILEKGIAVLQQLGSGVHFQNERKAPPRAKAHTESVRQQSEQCVGAGDCAVHAAVGDTRESGSGVQQHRDRFPENPRMFVSDGACSCLPSSRFSPRCTT